MVDFYPGSSSAALSSRPPSHHHADHQRAWSLLKRAVCSGSPFKVHGIHEAINCSCCLPCCCLRVVVSAPAPAVAAALRWPSVPLPLLLLLPSSGRQCPCYPCCCPPVSVSARSCCLSRLSSCCPAATTARSCAGWYAWGGGGGQHRKGSRLWCAVGRGMTGLGRPVLWPGG